MLRCQVHYTTTQLYCRVSRLLHKECVTVPSTLLHNTTLLPSVKVIAQGMCSVPSTLLHNTTLLPSVKVVAQGMCSVPSTLHHNTTLLPSVKVVAQGMCYGAKYTTPQYNFILECQGCCTRNVFGAKYTTPQLYCRVSRLLHKECVMVPSTLNRIFTPVIRRLREISEDIFT